MDPLHTIAHVFAPSPRDGVAYSAMPDAPVLPWRARRASPRLAVRRAVGRVHTVLPFGGRAAATARIECPTA